MFKKMYYLLRFIPLEMDNLESEPREVLQSQPTVALAASLKRKTDVIMRVKSEELDFRRKVIFETNFNDYF